MFQKRCFCDSDLRSFSNSTSNSLFMRNSWSWLKIFAADMKSAVSLCYPYTFNVVPRNLSSYLVFCILLPSTIFILASFISAPQYEHLGVSLYGLAAIASCIACAFNVLLHRLHLLCILNLVSSTCTSCVAAVLNVLFLNFYLWQRR